MAASLDKALYLPIHSPGPPPISIHTSHSQYSPSILNTIPPTFSPLLQNYMCDITIFASRSPFICSTYPVHLMRLHITLSLIHLFILISSRISSNLLLSTRITPVILLIQLSLHRWRRWCCAPDRATASSL